jgi:hypothetical protein
MEASRAWSWFRMPRMEQAKDWTGLPSGSHQFAAWASALSDTALTASVSV